MARAKAIIVGSFSPAPVDDSDDPYLLHRSDHSGLILVYHQLTYPNYHTWRHAMVMAFIAKNKLAFVDGTFPCPFCTYLVFAIWSQCDNIVSSWILNDVSKEIVDSLLYLDSISAIWFDLCEHFQQGNGPRIFQIKQHVLGLTQGTSDVSTYYTRLKMLGDELKEFRLVSTCICGGIKVWLDFQEQESIMQLLMGLNVSYSSIHGQILLQEPSPTLSKVFFLVVQDERQCTLGV